MLDDFLTRALIAALGVTLAAGPLGCFVIWRRMAYFGDATAHGAVLGVAMALGFGVSVFAGALTTAVIMAVLVSAMSHRGHSMDTALGVLSHSALALGLVAISFVQSVRVDVTSYLFGDILAVRQSDLLVIWGGAGLVLGLLVWRWNALLIATLNRDLARSAGIKPSREELILTLALAVVVAVAIKVVGALLIAAMLIIPAGAARALSRTPGVMAGIAVVIGAISALLGLWGSWEFDTPAGPSIVTAAAGIFVLTGVAGEIARRAQRAL